MISVVIPLYNKASHIQHTLNLAENSLRKAGVEYQIVIVNDGSKDDSVLKVKKWINEKEYRSQLSVIIDQVNQGVSVARNTGWQNAKYDLIAFLDADDEWLENHISDIVSLTKDYPDAVLYATAWAEVSTEGVKQKKTFGRGTENRGILPCFFDAMATGPMVVTSSTAATWKSCLKRTGGFMKDVSRGEDRIAWGKLALTGSVVFSPNIGAVWRKDAENRSEQTPCKKALSTFVDLCIEPALLSENTPNHLKLGLRNCWLSEKARSLGLVKFYDHNTPERLQCLMETHKELTNEDLSIVPELGFSR